MKHILQLLIYHMLSSLATALHLLSETIYGGQEVLAVAGIILMSYFHGSFFSFLFLILFYILNSFFKNNLKLAIHLQLLQNIGYIPHDVQHICEPVLHPVVCISHMPPPSIQSPPSTGNHCCSQYLGVCFFFCFIH